MSNDIFRKEREFAEAIAWGAGLYLFERFGRSFEVSDEESHVAYRRKIAP